jgi:hypothetical protein
LNWLGKTSSRRHLDSLIAFQRRKKVSKHFKNIFQRISSFILIK